MQEHRRNPSQALRHALDRPRTANAIIALRRAILSNRFDNFWEQRADTA